MQDRGNTPLHVAAHAGQAMQIELLVVHGANPCALDRLGHTPEECARIAGRTNKPLSQILLGVTPSLPFTMIGHHQLADRLIECQYELTDKISFFLCGRKPVHSIGEHFLVPQTPGSTTIGQTEARNRLQEVCFRIFLVPVWCALSLTCSPSSLHLFPPAPQ